MVTNFDRKGNTLILTIDLAKTPYKSKSAIAKAIKAGGSEANVEPTMLASTGGFQRCGDVKVSLNVTTVG